MRWLLYGGLGTAIFGLGMTLPWVLGHTYPPSPPIALWVLFNSQMAVFAITYAVRLAIKPYDRGLFFSPPMSNPPFQRLLRTLDLAESTDSSGVALSLASERQHQHGMSTHETWQEPDFYPSMTMHKAIFRDMWRRRCDKDASQPSNADEYFARRKVIEAETPR